MILERDQLKAPFPDSFEDTLFKEQAVRIRDQGKPGDLGCELTQDLVAPVRCHQLLAGSPLPASWKRKPETLGDCK